ncbi:ribonuclease E inhibitor RraB [Pelagerythrobacter sp.]|uniref:ribonuclease E inhibitor RraB n=1 Tax=Pelagerythrobacter sp. TaxID=2800702 RepID=UPI0035AEBC81
MNENLRQVELAKETLQVFRDHGEDMKDERHVIHFFYGGNFKALGAALTELGYETRQTTDDDGVIAERHEAIGEDWRTSTLTHLCELADSYGVEYDGWEASMERQQASKPVAKKPNGWLSKTLGKKN